MDNMPSVTRLLSLAKTFDQSAYIAETKAKAMRDAAELLRDHASDEASAARVVALLEMVASAISSGE